MFRGWLVGFCVLAVHKKGSAAEKDFNVQYIFEVQYIQHTYCRAAAWVKLLAAFVLLTIGKYILLASKYLRHTTLPVYMFNEYSYRYMACLGGLSLSFNHAL